MLEPDEDSVDDAGMARPTILVTGLHGMVGSHFEVAYGEQFELVPMDISHGVDVTDAAQVESIVGGHAQAVALIHLAAFTDVSAASKQEGDESGSCYRLNVGGTENVARSAARHGIHLVHVSTDFVFDGEKTSAYSEADEPNPIEWYGRTKYAAEQIVGRSDGSATILRTAFPYFSGQRKRPDMVARLRQRFVGDSKVQLFEDQMVTPTFGADLVTALYLFATIRPEGEIFHVTGSTSLSPFELGLHVAETFGLDAGKIEATAMVDYLSIDPRPRQKSLRIDHAKYCAFARQHGVARPIGIEEGLCRVRDDSRD